MLGAQRRFFPETSLKNVRAREGITMGSVSLSCGALEWPSFAMFERDGATLWLGTPPTGEALQFLTPTDVREALDGGDASRAGLARHLAPMVQAEVALMMTRYGAMRSRDGRQEIRDLTQEVFVVLFKDDAKTLRAWNPDAGRKLGSFVRMVAKRRLLSLMRTQSKNPWPDEPTDYSVVEHASSTPGVEPSVQGREELSSLMERLNRWFTPEDHALFRMFFVEGMSIAEVEAATNKSRAAIYAWRRHLRSFVRETTPDREAS